MTERDASYTSDGELAALGYDAGVAARDKLVVAGLSAPAIHSWLHAFLEGFTRAVGAQIRPASPSKIEPNLTESPLPVAPVFNTARVVRVSSVASSSGERMSLVTLDVEGLAATRAPGDELVILPSNSPDTVRELLRMLAIHPQTKVTAQSREMPAWQAFLETVRLDLATAALLEVMRPYARSRDEQSALDTMLEQFPEQPRSLVSVLRRFPAIRPPADEVLASLLPITGTRVPIASAPEESELSFLAQEQDFGDGYGVLTSALVPSCREGMWLTFATCRQTLEMPTLDPLAPVVTVCDDLGAAVARALLWKRLRLGHSGRNWLIGLGRLGQRNPALVNASSWGESNLCRRIDFLMDNGAVWTIGFDRITELLWRWLVDKSTLCVAIADPALRAEFNTILTQTVANRARVTLDAAAERMDTWKRAGQLIEWRAGPAGGLDSPAQKAPSSS